MPDTIVLKHVLVQHRNNVIRADNEEDYQRITVRRSTLFGDAFRSFSKPTFNVSKMLKVCFIGEPGAVDEGGPRREFFCLLIREMFSKSGIFFGWPENVIPMHNVEAVAKNKFYVIGKMITTSLVQCGVAPQCFARAIAEYLVFDHIRCTPCIDDIPDIEVKDMLLKVSHFTYTHAIMFPFVWTSTLLFKTRSREMSITLLSYIVRSNYTFNEATCVPQRSLCH